MQKEYDPGFVESKWQSIWQDRQLFRVEEDPAKKKYYLLEIIWGMCVTTPLET